MYVCMYVTQKLFHLAAKKNTFLIPLIIFCASKRNLELGSRCYKLPPPPLALALALALSLSLSLTPPSDLLF
jgi:hypothetical protein